MNNSSSDNITNIFSIFLKSIVLFSGLVGLIMLSEDFLSLISPVSSSTTSSSIICGVFFILSMVVGAQLKKDIKEINKNIFLI